MGFNNLHGHTEHSHLDAIIKVKDLFKRAGELGHTAVAITDHGVMSGLWEAYNEYKKTGIKFIPGNEIYFCEDLEDKKSKRGHLILLASNEVGYRNILRLTAEGYDKPANVMGRVVPRIDASMLRKNQEGLFCTSACMSSLLADGIFKEDFTRASDLALLLKDIFGDRFYLELQPHNLSFTKKDKQTGKLLFYSQKRLNDELIKVAKKNKIHMVATCDSHYLVPEHEVYHDMIQAISSKKDLFDLNRKRYATKEPCPKCEGHGVYPIDSKTKCDTCVGSGIGRQIPCPEYYLKSEDDIRSYFSEHYSADFAEYLINNTQKIVDSCDNPDYIEPTGFRLPTFDMKHIAQKSDVGDFIDWRSKNAKRQNDPDDVSYLKYRCFKRFKEYCGQMPYDKKVEYWERVLKEVALLEKRGFCSYMLIVSDYMEWAMSQDIYTGPGRGSGGGSLVGYFLNIHEIDPIRYGLIFERFVNEHKKDLPDYDNDFAPSGLAAVLEYVEDKYGSEYVARISNISKMTPKVAIKDISRSLLVGGDKSTAFKLANDVTKTIPDSVELSNGKTVEVRTIDLAKEYSKTLRDFLEEYPEVESHAKMLTGLPRNFSVHAAGVVISDVPLPEYAPLRRDKDGTLALQYDKYTTEDTGLVKMDFLGLETLDVFKETYESAKAIGIDLPYYREIPENDPKTFRLIHTGRVLGLFQLDGSTMSKWCKPMMPTSIEDLAALNAIARPSCSNEERQQFINRKFKREKVTFPHPILKDDLSETYGISVYDEQLLKIAETVAGWDLAKADSLRKLTKNKAKNPEFALQQEREFIADAMNVNGLSKKEAQLIWTDVIEPFSGYGFNKSHAVAYGLNGYRTAYYKAHATAPFLCATLNSRIKNNAKNRDEKVDAARRDIRSFNIAIKPCDINKSKEYYSVLDKKTIVTGFGAIKGIGEKAINEIVANQPYSSFPDFLHKVSSSKVNKTVIQSLAMAGAFDCFGISRKYAYDSYAFVRDKVNQYAKKFEDGYDIFGTRDRIKEFNLYLKNSFEKTTKEVTWPNEKWSVRERMLAEKMVLGEFVSGSYDELFPGFFKGGQWNQSFKAIQKLPNKHPVSAEGVIVSYTELQIKRGQNAGQPFAKLMLENVVGEDIELTMWTDTYLKYKKLLEKGYLPIRGMFKVNEFNGKNSLVVAGNLEVYEVS